MMPATGRRRARTSIVMAKISLRFPVAVPVLRLGAPKPLPPDKRAHDTFRITTRFEDPDTLGRRGPNGKVLRHNALDIGNFRCGDVVVAMAGGIARRTHDEARANGAPTDALGIIIDHGAGVVTEYWHLSSFSVENGAEVKAGDPIGFVGRTGHGGACHCHIELKVNGKRVDPEPAMFGGGVEPKGLSANVANKGGGTMALRFGGARYRGLTNRRFTTHVVARFRAEPNRKSTVLKEFKKGTVVIPSGVVKGEDVANVAPAKGFASDEWFEARLHTGAAFELGYFHASTLGDEKRVE